MKTATNLWVAIRSRILNVVGLTAAGAGMVTLASSGQVFASQFLQEATQANIPSMVYSPELQMMVRPDTNDPVFGYTQGPHHGKVDGEYQMAPLVTCPGSPGCPAQPTHSVTPGGGPNGSGPTSDKEPPTIDRIISAPLA